MALSTACLPTKSLDLTAELVESSPHVLSNHYSHHWQQQMLVYSSSVHLTLLHSGPSYLSTSPELQRKRYCKVFTLISFFHPNTLWLRLCANITPAIKHSLLFHRSTSPTFTAGKNKHFSCCSDSQHSSRGSCSELSPYWSFDFHLWKTQIFGGFFLVFFIGL